MFEKKKSPNEELKLRAWNSIRVIHVVVGTKVLNHHLLPPRVYVHQQVAGSGASNGFLTQVIVNGTWAC